MKEVHSLCDDVLRGLGHHDDPQARLSSAQVMTMPLVAAAFFGGKVERARVFLLEHGYIRQPLSKSRLNRRWHALPLSLWQTLFDLLGEVFKQHNPTSEYAVDSMPLAACDNIRDNIGIQRCQLLPQEEHRGYCASQHRFFFGLKVHLLITDSVHLLITGQGEPVEFVLTPGATADLNGLKALPLALPAGCTIHGDRAYTDYPEEDLL